MHNCRRRVPGLPVELNFLEKCFKEIRQPLGLIFPDGILPRSFRNGLFNSFVYPGFPVVSKTPVECRIPAGFGLNDIVHLTAILEFAGMFPY